MSCIFFRFDLLHINIFRLFILCKAFLSSPAILDNFAVYISLGWLAQSFRTYSALFLALLASKNSIEKSTLIPMYFSLFVI